MYTIGQLYQDLGEVGLYDLRQDLFNLKVEKNWQLCSVIRLNGEEIKLDHIAEESLKYFELNDRVLIVELEEVKRFLDSLIEKRDCQKSKIIRQIFNSAYGVDLIE